MIDQITYIGPFIAGSIFAISAIYDMTGDDKRANSLAQTAIFIMLMVIFFQGVAQ